MIQYCPVHFQDGHQFKLKYLRPCDNDTSGYAVTLENVDPVLTQDCRIMSKGCVNITKEVNNVQVSSCKSELTDMKFVLV